MTQTNDPPLISSLELIPDAAEKADLDAPNTSGGKLVIGQAPNITITETTVVADAAERLALDVQEGDIAIQTNVSSSFIFTGGDNVAPNWQELDFDAVGAISGEDISPDNITALGQLSGQSLSVTGAINGADTSAAAAGEALTADGSGGFTFASVGGIQTVATFNNLPTPTPPQIGFVTDEQAYYVSQEGGFDLSTANAGGSEGTAGGSPSGVQVLNNTLYQTSVSQDRAYQAPITNGDVTTEGSRQSINVQGNPSDIHVSPDGTLLYISGIQGINQYDLPTPYDITTLTNQQNLTSTAGGYHAGISFARGGELLFNAIDIGVVEKYELSSPFDVTTATRIQSVSSSVGNGPFDVDISIDGTLLYEVDIGGSIIQSELNTPFDLTTLTADFTYQNVDSSIRGMDFNDSGSRMYEIGQGSNNITQHDLDGATEWNQLQIS